MKVGTDAHEYRSAYIQHHTGYMVFNLYGQILTYVNHNEMFYNVHVVIVII